ncbi:MAG: hypothetical protein JWM47_4238 [Acidimicrobiales bacterium]|jgi:hypothetical protein|nr:hypothetical protein [Acidimicrobiales bacterium]
MSGGPVGAGVSYWANIKISGNLDETELKAVRKKIKDILDGTEGTKTVDGKFVSEARVSNNNSAVTLNVTY